MEFDTDKSKAKLGNFIKETDLIMKKAVSLIMTALLLGSAAVSCNSKEGSDILTYRYNYDLSEYIELAEYKGLPAEGYKINITEENIQQQILATRSYYSKLTDVTERGADYGDTIYVNYTGTVDGKEAEGASEDDAEITIGAGSMPEDFENALMGAYAGDKLSFDVTFPDPYLQYPDLSGQLVHFEAEITNVCEQELPEYTDDFVRAYLGYDSIEEYEKSIYKLLEDHYYEIYYQTIDSQIWNTIIENTKVIKYPEKELREIYDDMVSSVEAYALTYNINFADYVKAMYNKTEDEFYDYAKEESEAYVKDEMIKYAIARAENITLSDKEYADGAEEYAKEIYKLDSVEAFEAIYSKETIRQTLLFEKVHEAVVDYADVTLKDNK